MYDRPNFCLPLEIERKLKLLYIIAPKELIILHDAQVESTPKHPQMPIMVDKPASGELGADEDKNFQTSSMTSMESMGDGERKTLQSKTIAQEPTIQPIYENLSIGGSRLQRTYTIYYLSRLGKNIP